MSRRFDCFRHLINLRRASILWLLPDIMSNSLTELKSPRQIKSSVEFVTLKISLLRIFRKMFFSIVARGVNDDKYYFCMFSL